MGDLVERLRAFAVGCRGSMWQSRDETIALCDQSADEILRLRARLDAVEKERDMAKEGWAEAQDLIRVARLQYSEEKARAERAEAEVVRLTDELAEEQRISILRGNMIEFELMPALHDAEAALSTARRDALLEAAKICDCRDREKDDSMYLVGCIDASQANAKRIRALADEAET